MSNGKGKTNLQKYEDLIAALETARAKYALVENKETKTALKAHGKILDLKLETAKAKKVKDVVNLSQTCKTWIKELAKEEFYGYQTQINTKYMDKGNLNEDKAIKQLNYSLGTAYAKNEERKTNGILSGECDINDQGSEEIRDIKNAWSLETFPILREDVDQKSKEAGYDWQQKGYLILWGYKRAYIDYCFTDTPKDLLTQYDNFMIHEQDPKIGREKYITTSSVIELGDKDEAEVKRRHKAAQKYYNELLTELKAK